MYVHSLYCLASFIYFDDLKSIHTLVYIINSFLTPPRELKGLLDKVSHKST